MLQVKKKLNQSEEKFAKRLGVSRRSVRNWINESRLLPESTFNQLADYAPSIESFRPEIIEVRSQTWGQKKGGRKRVKEMRKKGTLARHLEKMLVARRKNIVTTRLEIPSESEFTKEIRKNSPQSLAVLMALLMTDGYVAPKNNIIGFTSTDFTLVNIFTDLVIKNSDKTPHIIERKSGIFTSYVYDPKLVRKLLARSPSYKTAPEKQATETYFEEPQPTIQFILKQNTETRVKCIRLAMSADGCIAIQNESKKPFRIRGRLFFSCAHRKLLTEWTTLFHRLGLPLLRVERDDYWNGVAGIASVNKTILKQFMDYGGFVDGVNITKKSKRFAGYEKNALLKTAIKNTSFESWKEIYSSLTR